MSQRCRLTNTNLPNQIFKPITTKHFPKYLFGILESTSWFCGTTTILLTEFIIFMTKFWV